MYVHERKEWSERISICEPQTPKRPETLFLTPLVE
jgi:hypothetical protein